MALVARWRDAIDRFTGGDPKLREAIVVVVAAQSRLPAPDGMPGFHDYFHRALT
jgi:hypothetical protein